MSITRQTFLITAVSAMFIPQVARASGNHRPRVVSYRSPGCTCCEGWMAAMQTAGYDVTTLDDPHYEDRNRREGITPDLASCHVAYVRGYVVVGHMPPGIVDRMLREHPHIHGISLPGMPPGSPGMPGEKIGPWRIMVIEAKPRVYAEV
jgi:hypothetical protein